MDPKNINLAPSSLIPAHSAATEPESSLAAQRVAADMALIADADVEAVNLDPVGLVTSVLASWTRVSTYLPAMASLPGVDTSRIAKLRDYALALAFWQGRSQSSGTPAPELAPLVARGVEIRDRTLADLQALVNHGLLSASRLENFVGTPAHRKLGLDLISLSVLVHDEWATLGGKTLITLDAMDEAARLGERILQAVGDREGATSIEVSSAQKQRNKAYTLVVRTYAQARRALAFLRYDEGDADTILPSLYTGRGGRKRADEAAAQADAHAATEGALAPASSGPVVYSSMIGAPPPKA